MSLNDLPDAEVIRRLVSAVEAYMSDHDLRDPPVCDCSLCRHTGALLVELVGEKRIPP